MPVLETRDDAFFLNGKKTLLLSGAVHYFRVVPEYWRDRLLKVKAAGLNCVETYVAWNAHEAVRGTFDFSGILDLRRFIQIAQDVGLYVLLRPGPYICSEWDFGGLPSWLLHDPEMKVRTSYPPYLEAVDAYLAKILPLVNDLQMSKGGPIIAVQLENEYGSYGDDLDYKLFLKNVSLTSPVLLDGQVMQDWEITPLEWKSDFLERVRQSNEWTPCTENAFQNRPVLYESSLVVDGDPRDTFVQLKGWGKGFVIVNGFNIGRYWDLGPQETLYLPGPLLKKGNNEIFIFEYHEANPSRSVSFVAEPFLGEPRLHTTYIPFYGRMFITALKTALWFGPWVWRLLRLFVK
ncbi:hypothetical protein CAPTEDRAFT_226658 [Capitella teleta]|uniref:Uncharacterized protein n=1 Tax=Capitella teleta TaxID=283909 RepID=R7US57_CAPTE|nr:hypothetical protein CAPTEDRAFT_226658 [Capitella teleta]|eukprot:ELU09030.1 hypothetical protein CAPTEDRAFT_226658 [Capitella teleta]